MDGVHEKGAQKPVLREYLRVQGFGLRKGAGCHDNMVVEERVLQKKGWNRVLRFHSGHTGLLR